MWCGDASGECSLFSVTQTFIDGKYQLPTHCGNSSCRSRSFRPLRQTSVTQDWQVIKLQEVGEVDAFDAGRIPRTLEVHLLGDLVDDVTPGVIVTVTGVVKVCLFSSLHRSR